MTSRTAGFGILTMLALTIYFTIAAMLVGADAWSPAEHALVKGLGIIAGGCGLTALAFVALSLRLQVAEDVRIEKSD